MWWVQRSTETAPLTDDVNPTATATERRGHIHRTIGNVVKLAPTALFELFPVLSDFFPHKRHPLHVHVEYVSQLLQLCETFPSLQQKVLDLILRRGLEMDVDIVIEDSGEALIRPINDDDNGATGIEELFQLDDNDMSMASQPRQRQGISGMAMGAQGGLGAGVGGLKICGDAGVVEMADKLDAVLVLLLEYIKQRAVQLGVVPSVGIEGDCVSSGGRGQHSLEEGNGVWKKLFFQLLDAFEVRVMTTYKAKFVQFAVFYMCQLDNSLGRWSLM